MDEVVTLPDETSGDVLCGFTKCINEDFKTVFQHLLIQERFDHFSSCSLIAPQPIVLLLLLKPTLPKSSVFSVMLMISTTAMEPPTNRLYIVLSVHVPLW